MLGLNLGPAFLSSGVLVMALHVAVHEPPTDFAEVLALVFRLHCELE